jgi:hypothetical protein
MGKLLEHATALYRALDAAATTEIVNGKETRVFRGSIVECFRSTKVSQAFYSGVRRGLINSESITIIRQGSRSAESIIVLHREPDEESLVTNETLGLTNDSEAGIVFQELKDLRHLIGSISIPDALVNIEQRLQEFDNRITKVEQQINPNRDTRR